MRRVILFVSICVVLLLLAAGRAGSSTEPPEQPTPTPRPPMVRDQLNNRYPMVDVRDLIKSPDTYVDQRIHLTGTVFNIKEKSRQTTMQIWVQAVGKSREAVAVGYDGPLPGLYNTMTVDIYGVGKGTFEGANAFGADLSQPAVLAEYIAWDNAP